MNNVANSKTIIPTKVIYHLQIKKIIKIKKENYKNKTKDMNHGVLKLKFGVLEKVIYIPKKKKTQETVR